MGGGAQGVNRKWAPLRPSDPAWKPRVPGRCGDRVDGPVAGPPPYRGAQTSQRNRVPGRYGASGTGRGFAAHTANPGTGLSPTASLGNV